jgi:hypothetical protein
MPFAIQGRDIIGCAQTGTGKTASLKETLWSSKFFGDYCHVCTFDEMSFVFIAV